MNWDQIEIKWAEMTSRLKADGIKGRTGVTLGSSEPLGGEAVLATGPREAAELTPVEMKAN